MTDKPECREIEPLLHGLLDGELDAANTLKCEQHIASCAACAAAYQALVVQRNMIRAANLREPAPERLQHRVSGMIDRKKNAARFLRPFRSAGLARRRRDRRRIVRLHHHSARARSRRAGRGEPRALADGQPSRRRRQHRSSHGKAVVRGSPRFLAADLRSFGARLHTRRRPRRLSELTPGRGGRLSPRRPRHQSLHLAQHAGDAAPVAPLVREGYNVRNWTKLGMNCWAVSDMNAEELARSSASFARPPSLKG